MFKTLARSITFMLQGFNNPRVKLITRYLSFKVVIVM